MHEVRAWHIQTHRRKRRRDTTKKAYDFISVVVPKGKRKRIAEYAASQGKSMNRFINDAIDAQLPPEKPEE